MDWGDGRGVSGGLFYFYFYFFHLAATRMWNVVVEKHVFSSARRGRFIYFFYY